jgi:hypothetical protein
MQVTSPAGRDTPDPAPAPRWARWFVAVYLGLFVLCGVAGFEAWPLTGWRLFADARQARQPGFQAVTVDGAGRETPVPFRDLPAGYHGDVQVLRGFAGLAATRQARQPGFQAVTVDGAGRETPVPFRDLPAGYHGDVQVLRGFAGLTATRQAAVCQAWATAVRVRGGEVAEVRIYQTVTDVSRRAGDRGAPPERTLRFTCRPGRPG